tara:strand:- start:407 stop:607 length:201 start_codon:yes stop_codon:yes gene_type:complete
MVPAGLTFAAGAAVAAGLAAGTLVGALAPVPVVDCAGVVAAAWGAVVSDDPQATNRKRHSNKGVSR